MAIVAHIRPPSTSVVNGHRTCLHMNSLTSRPVLLSSRKVHTPGRMSNNLHLQIRCSAQRPEKASTPAKNPSSADVTVESAPSGPTSDASLPVQLAWYASEAFGKVAAVFKNPAGSQRETDDVDEKALATRDEVLTALREDYGKSYFVTGDMSMWIYDPDCEFADPFVSFKGRGRFKQNVSNLGSFMEDVSLKVLDWQESEGKVTTKWRFSCVLGLPWRPILAASGGTDHYFDASTGETDDLSATVRNEPAAFLGVKHACRIRNMHTPPLTCFRDERG